MIGIKTSVKLGIIAIFSILLIGIAYQSGTAHYKDELRALEEDIAAKNTTLTNIEAEIASLGTGIEVSAEFCTSCHDKAHLTDFHYPTKIKLIDESRNRTARICTKCHGQVPHDIHRRLLEDKKITCQACHIRDGEFRVPKPKRGQLLVCELCHADGSYIRIHIDGKKMEGGDVDPQWIKEGEKHPCTICHMGSVVQIHKEKTESLGRIPENVTIA